MKNLKDDFFNESKKTPKNKRLATIQALEEKASEINASLSSIYAELGEKYYSNHKGLLPANGYEEVFGKLDGAHNKLAEISSEIDRLNSDKVCQNCGQTLKEGAGFCPACGCKTKRIDEPGACSNCGKPLEDGALFCMVCGQPVKGAAPAAAESAEDRPKENVCPKCNKKLRPGAGFCSGCGYRIN